MVSIRLLDHLLLALQLLVVSVSSQSTIPSWGVGSLRVGRDVVAQQTKCPSEYYTFYKTPAYETEQWCRMLCCQCHQRRRVPYFLMDLLSHCHLFPNVDYCIHICIEFSSGERVFDTFPESVTHPPTHTTPTPPVVPTMTTIRHAATTQNDVSFCPIECTRYQDCTGWFCTITIVAKWVASPPFNALIHMGDRLAKCGLSNCHKTLTHKIGPLGTTEAQKLKSECGLSKPVRSRRHFKWIGGDLAQPGDHPWAVLIFRIIPEFFHRDYPLFCSGTLISQRHVLTALHCIRSERIFGLIDYGKIACSGPLDPGKFESYRIHYGTTSWSESMTHPTANETLPAEARLGVAYKYHTPCRKNGRSYIDLAILEFLPEAPPPDDMQRPICLPDNSPLSQTLQQRLHGFGFGDAIHPEVDDDNRGVEARTKRLITVEAHVYDDGYNGSIWNHRFSLNMQPSTACGGDSGAGVTQTVDGREQVVGVVVKARNTTSSACPEIQAAVERSPPDTAGTDVINLREFVDFFCDKAGICP